MTKIAVSKIGPKGQIVLKKQLREKAGMKEGMLIEEQLIADGILIRRVDSGKLLKEIETVAEKVSKQWPPGLTAAAAVRRERR